MLCSFLPCSKVVQLNIYILFHYGLAQDIECSPLCYTVGPCYLSILYTLVCICSPHSPNPPLPHSHSFLASANLFSMSVCFCFICVMFYLCHVHLCHVLFILFLGPHLEACRILVPQPEIKPRPWQ